MLKYPILESPLVESTISFVKEQLSGAEAGHDWFHTERVLNNAMQIAKGENANMEVVALGALLHDIADPKFHDGDETVGPRMAKDFLNEHNSDKDLVEHVVQIIKNISFKNSLDGNSKFESPELFIVRDADRLDAIGAIGIARCFNYGGFKNRPFYDPEIPPKLNMTKEEYKKAKSPTINHFYEKLLLLKDRMHTETGRQIAEERHNYMLKFLDQFFLEWHGEG